MVWVWDGLGSNGEFLSVSFDMYHLYHFAREC